MVQVRNFEDNRDNRRGILTQAGEVSLALRESEILNCHLVGCAMRTSL